jgi:hypothetical protein
MNNNLKRFILVTKVDKGIEEQTAINCDHITSIEPSISPNQDNDGTWIELVNGNKFLVVEYVICILNEMNVIISTVKHPDDDQ